jgi:RNA ligase (TIGR02306 family)
MQERKLATIRRITELKPITGADKIELAIVDGWQSVVKKDEYKVNDLVVYLEVDSWVPHTLAPFLTKSGHYPKVYQGVEGQRLKTMKLKGELSQGLILPLSIFSEIEHGYLVFGKSNPEGADVTELLGILKWEKEIPAQLAGIMKGSFPSAIPKTDQERVQNLTKKLQQYHEEHIWEVTEKLDGSSCTFYLDREGEFHVCSRNVNLKEVEGNSFWDIARKYDVENAMKNAGMYGFAIQGELVGPGIQGNQYGLSEVDFYVFDMYSTHDNTYAPSYYRVEITEKLGLKHVPVLFKSAVISSDINKLLEAAEGTSALNASQREGIVFKSVTDPEVSFKVISTSWLISNDG